MNLEDYFKQREKLEVECKNIIAEAKKNLSKYHEIAKESHKLRIEGENELKGPWSPDHTKYSDSIYLYRDAYAYYKKAEELWDKAYSMIYESDKEYKSYFFKK